jgi:hypothetical protein
VRCAPGRAVLAAASLGRHPVLCATRVICAGAANGR